MKRLGHASSLDGMRGVGAIAVVSAHYFGFLPGGFYSMEVFFALSGFLITTLLLEENDRRGRIALGSFYDRRARRLLPGLLVVLVAYACISVPSAPLHALEKLAAGGLYATNIVIMTGHDHILYDTPFYPFWSLAEEEQFYLLWPLILLVLMRRRVRESRVAAGLAGFFLALAVYRAGLVLAHANPYRVYYSPDTHADALVLGSLLALLRRGGLRIPQPVGWLGLAALVSICAFMRPTAAVVGYGLGPMAIAATLLVGAALEAGLLSRCLSLRPLMWIGTISYSLYVWHYFVFWLLSWHAPLLGLPISLIVATLSYYLVEKPLRRRRTARSASAPRTAVASA